MAGRSPRAFLAGVPCACAKGSAGASHGKVHTAEGGADHRPQGPGDTESGAKELRAMKLGATEVGGATESGATGPEVGAEGEKRPSVRLFATQPAQA
jgi:hypothetical protein